MDSLPPWISKTFEEYAMLDVLSTIQSNSAKYKWTDVVFDIYRRCVWYLKAETRFTRGRAVRRTVIRDIKIPSNWRNFLKDNDNKYKLFNFLVDKIACVATLNVVIVTKDDNAVNNHTIWQEWHHVVMNKLTCRSLCMPCMQQKLAARSSWSKPLTQMLSLQSVFYRNFRN